jgi:solute carrier family 25 (mitochondrial phosphate transporter), member 23/24/25/41
VLDSLLIPCFYRHSDFLLFMPNPSTSTTLRAVFTFYSDIVTLTSEGDSLVSDDKRHGLGTTASSLLQVMFGSIVRLALPGGRDAISSQEPPSPFKSSTSLEEGDESTRSTPPQAAPKETASLRKPVGTGVVAQGALRKTTPATTTPSTPSGEDDGDDSQGSGEVKKKFKLTKYIPDPGYFAAGAAAGGISRTATAPLDRLKVYLLVDTRTNAADALKAAQKGRPLQALKHGGRSFFMAVSDIYKSGGIRGFFAGMSYGI